MQRVFPAVLFAGLAGAAAFVAAALAAAAVLFAFAVSFERVWLGYLAAAAVSSAVSAGIFSFRTPLPRVVCAALWAVLSAAFHAALTGLASPAGTHRLPILCAAAGAAFLCGLLFGRNRPAKR